MQTFTSCNITDFRIQTLRERFYLTILLQCLENDKFSVIVAPKSLKSKTHSKTLFPFCSRVNQLACFGKHRSTFHYRYA